MPTNRATAQTRKKRSQKKSTTKSKSKSKQPLSETNKNIKPVIKTKIPTRSDLNSLTAANISSLRWENTLPDPILDSNRIEQYKELRRQRYNEARQQAIDNLIERMQIKLTDGSENRIVI